MISVTAVRPERGTSKTGGTTEEREDVRTAIVLVENETYLMLEHGYLYRTDSVLVRPATIEFPPLKNGPTGSTPEAVSYTHLTLPTKRIV